MDDSAGRPAAPYGRRRLIAVVIVGGVLVGGLGALLSSSSSGGSASASKPAGPPPGPISLVWVGDTTLGSSAGDPPDAGRGLFSSPKVRSRLRRPNLAFANLEGTLAGEVTGAPSKCGGENTGTCFAFAAPSANAAALKWAGIDIVNLANNHANDFGPAGEYATIQALFAQGIAHTGLPNEITVLRRGHTRIAFVGFAAYPWAARLDDLVGAAALVRQAAARADIVVVAMHAGAEGREQTHTPVGVEEAYGENRGDTRAFAHAAVDAGADLVVGSGPHVVRGIEAYHGKLIAYSLGNFAGWKNFAQGGVLSLSAMLSVKIAGDGKTLSARWIPLVLADPGVPEPDTSRQSTALVQQVSKEDFGPTAAQVSRSGRITPP